MAVRRQAHARSSAGEAQRPPDASPLVMVGDGYFSGMPFFNGKETARFPQGWRYLKARLKARMATTATRITSNPTVK